MVKLPDLALSLPLLALNFGLLAFQVFAAPTVAGSDVAPISAEPTWRLYRGSDPEGAISSASTTAAHLARRDDDSWIQCSDDSKFKVKVDDVKACRKKLSSVDIVSRPGCLHTVTAPLWTGSTVSYNTYCTMGSAMLIPWGDAAMPLSERYGNCHQVANAVWAILKTCTGPDGMVAGWTSNLGGANADLAGVKIVKSVARVGEGKDIVWAGNGI